MHAEYLRSYGSVLPHRHPELPEGRCCPSCFVDRGARRVRSRLRRRIAAPSSPLVRVDSKRIFWVRAPRATGWGRRSASPCRCTGCGRFTRSGCDMTYLSGVAHPLLPTVSGLGQETGKRTSTRQTCGVWRSLGLAEQRRLPTVGGRQGSSSTRPVNGQGVHDV